MMVHEESVAELIRRLLRLEPADRGKALADAGVVRTPSCDLGNPYDIQKTVKRVEQYGAILERLWDALPNSADNPFRKEQLPPEPPRPPQEVTLSQESIDRLAAAIVRAFADSCGHIPQTSDAVFSATNRLTPCAVCPCCGKTVDYVVQRGACWKCLDCWNDPNMDGLGDHK